MSSTGNPGAAGGRARRWSDRVVPVGWVLAALLPLVGLVSLLLRSHLDPDFTNPRLHFVLFLTVGALVAGLAYAAGRLRRPARRRPGAAALARVPGHRRVPAAPRGRDAPASCSWRSVPGFHVAIPVGLLIAAVFGDGVGVRRPAPRLRAVRGAAPTTAAALGVVAALVWFAWTVLRLPPLESPDQRGRRRQHARRAGRRRLRAYVAAALRYLVVFRDGMSLLPRASSPASCCSPRRWSVWPPRASAAGTRAGGSGTG